MVIVIKFYLTQHKYTLWSQNAGAFGGTDTALELQHCKPFTTLLLIEFCLTQHIHCLSQNAGAFGGTDTALELQHCKPFTTLLLIEFCLTQHIHCLSQNAGAFGGTDTALELQHCRPFTTLLLSQFTTSVVALECIRACSVCCGLTFTCT